MPQVRAVVVDPSRSEKLTLQSVELPPATIGDVTVRVTAISLNRGEVNRALSQSDAGARPGWDFAGIIEEAAADGSGPKPGTRVVGILPTGAWAERIRAPSHAVAALPDAVTDAQAATLPVAGLTALHALRQGGLLLGRKVLVDGATGGVGHLAVQLAATAGAEVYGHVRRAEQRTMISEWCGEHIIVASNLGAAASSGPYHLIVDFDRRLRIVRGAYDAATERHLCALRCFGSADHDVRERRVLPPGRREAVWPDPVPRTAPRGTRGGRTWRCSPARLRAAGCVRISRSRRRGPTSPRSRAACSRANFAGKAVLHVT